jgi:hypothetical protein
VGRRAERKSFRRSVKPWFEQLEERAVPTVSFFPTWVDQGSSPIDTKGLPQTSVNAANNAVTGAIDSVAIDPNNVAHMFVGTVNGGIWRTMNGNNQFKGSSDNPLAFPDWTPVTDHLPSLAIDDIRFDPLDPTGNTVYAGTGSSSSLAQLGGASVGVLRTQDNGNNWTVTPIQAQPGFGMPQILAILPTKSNAEQGTPGFHQLILVGTDTGLERSSDGGASYSMSFNLPSGAVTQLLADPNVPDKFYAAVTGPGGGVFVSTPYQGHVGTNWTEINNGLGDTLVGNTTVQLAVDPGGGTTVLYTFIAGDFHEGVFKYDGTTWHGLADLPQNFVTNTTTTQAQARITIDPTNTKIVYVTRGYGDTPAILRYDPTIGSEKWLDIDQGANGTYPHLDSRDIAFAGTNILIYTSDGGIFYLRNPQVPSFNTWTSMAGSGATGLGVTEYHDVAWDSRFKVVIGGAQDNGTSVQNGPGNPVWTQVDGSDGGDVQVDPVSAGANMESLRYTSDQYLKFLRRRTYSSPLGAMGSVDLLPAGGLPSFKGPFIPRYQLDAVDPGRLVISGGGSSPVYELLNAATATSAATAKWVKVPVPPEFFPIPTDDQGTPLVWGFAYGGRLNGVDNPDVLVIASGVKVFVRSTAGGMLMPTKDLPINALAVQDIVLDPNNWHHFFVVDGVNVFETVNAGASWKDITGNLHSVNDQIYSVAFVPTGSGTLLVGGNLGVSRLSLGDKRAQWTRYGAGLPNAVVKDLRYYPAPAGPDGKDILVAGTLGRGAWTLNDVSASIQTPGILTIDGTPGDDVIRLATDPYNTALVDAFVNSATPTYQVEWSVLANAQINVNGEGGNNTLIVDLDTATSSGVNYIITSTGVSRTGAPPISYTNIQHLQVKTGSASNIVVDVLSTNLNTVTQVSDADTVKVGNAGHLDGILGTVYVNNGSGLTQLTVNDSFDKAYKNVTLDTVNAGFFGVGRISGLAPADIKYAYLETAGVTIDTGIGGATVQVEATGVPVNLVGYGNDLVNVGYAGNVQQIFGDLTISGPPASATLTVDDSLDSTHRDVTHDTVTIGGMDYGRISGLAPAAIEYCYIATNSVNVKTGMGGATVNVKSTGSLLELTANANDKVNVGDAGSVQQINGLLAISDPPAFVTLSVDDSADASPRTFTMDTVGNGFGRIIGLAPAPIEYKYTDTDSVTLQTGTGAVIANVQATGVPVNMIGHASSTVNVGAAGSVQQINGALTITQAPAASVALTVDDSADPFGRTVLLGGDGATSSIVGLAPAAINYPTNAIFPLIVNGGSGNNFYIVNGSPTLFSATLNTGGGTDVVDILAIASPLTINSAGGSGADAINLGNASNSLSNIVPGIIFGGITINAAVTDTLTLNDQGTPDPRTYTVTATSVSWTGGPTVHYSGVGPLAVNGGTGADTFKLASSSATAAPTITGGGGNNTAIGSNMSNTWTLAGTNAGVLSGPAYQRTPYFFNIQNLTAGPAGDDFVFQDGASITGNLTGGGHDTLDYRKYSISVIVDLQAPFAGVNTGVGGTVSGVSTVFGGTAQGSPLVYNLLIGNGNNLLVGGTGRRNILVAGGVPSTLIGGDGEDLMITGTTIYDTQPGLASWYMIAQYWASGDSFANRAANLLAGNGVPLLDASTVTGNGSGNTLLGKGGELLLYNDRLDAVIDYLFVQPVPISP